MTAPAPNVEQPPSDDAQARIDRLIAGGNDASVDETAVEALAAAVDPDSMPSALGFASGAERELSQFADAVLREVMSDDLGSIHNDLMALKTAVQSLVSGANFEQQGWFSRMFGSSPEASSLRDDMRVTQGQVDSVSMDLEDQLHGLQHRLASLDKLFAQYVDKFESIGIFIAAADRAVERIKRETLPPLEAQSERNTDPVAKAMMEQRIGDARRVIEIIEGRRQSLEHTRTIAYMMLPTIRGVQTAGLRLVTHLRSTLTETVPMWKSAVAAQMKRLEQGSTATGGANAPSQADAEKIRVEIAASAQKFIEALEDADVAERAAEEARNLGQSTLTGARITLDTAAEGASAKETATG